MNENKLIEVLQKINATLYSCKGQLTNIEKYLGLDFYLDDNDNYVPIIDYSYITDNDIRLRLISDSREMLRNRFGTRNHKQDFKEFCRFAHLQCEMLINYYYNTKNSGNIESIKKHIQQYNKKANFTDKSINNISAIAYMVKLWAFRAEFESQNKKEISKKFKLYYGQERRFCFDYLSVINTIRNEESHRSPSEAKNNNLKDLKDEMTDCGTKFYNDGCISFIDFNSRANDLKQQYTYKLFLATQPFAKVIAILKSLNDVVKDHLSSELTAITDK